MFIDSYSTATPQGVYVIYPNLNNIQVGIFQSVRSGDTIGYNADTYVNGTGNWFFAMQTGITVSPGITSSRVDPEPCITGPTTSPPTLGPSTMPTATFYPTSAPTLCTDVACQVITGTYEPTSNCDDAEFSAAYGVTKSEAITEILDRSDTISGSLPLFSTALNHFVNGAGDQLNYTQTVLETSGLYLAAEVTNIESMVLTMANVYGGSMSVGTSLSFLDCCFCNAIDDATTQYPEESFSDFGKAVGMSFRLYTDGMGCLYKISSDTYGFKMELDYVFKDSYDFESAGNYSFTLWPSEIENLQVAYCLDEDFVFSTTSFFDQYATYSYEKCGTVDISAGIVFIDADCSTALCDATPPTLSPTQLPTKLPTPLPTDRPTTSPSNRPTRSPTSKPTFSPTKIPSGEPTDRPTYSPTDSPTGEPTDIPSRPPTNKPTRSPTNRPSFSPTPSPTNNPSNAPSVTPSNSPSLPPTQYPTQMPTLSPSHPTAAPTRLPFRNPTDYPTTIAPNTSPTIDSLFNATDMAIMIPSFVPSSEPTPKLPTPEPTTSPPTNIPTKIPSVVPSGIPTDVPTDTPTDVPTVTPSMMPTNIPSLQSTKTDTVKTTSILTTDVSMINGTTPRSTSINDATTTSTSTSTSKVMTTAIATSAINVSDTNTDSSVNISISSTTTTTDGPATTMSGTSISTNTITPTSMDEIVNNTLHVNVNVSDFRSTMAAGGDTGTSSTASIEETMNGNNVTTDEVGKGNARSDGSNVWISYTIGFVVGCFLLIILVSAAVYHFYYKPKQRLKIAKVDNGIEFANKNDGANQNIYKESNQKSAVISEYDEPGNIDFLDIEVTGLELDTANGISRGEADHDHPDAFYEGLAHMPEFEKVLSNSAVTSQGKNKTKSQTTKHEYIDENEDGDGDRDDDEYEYYDVSGSGEYEEYEEYGSSHSDYSHHSLYSNHEDMYNGNNNDQNQDIAIALPNDGYGSTPNGNIKDKLKQTLGNKHKQHQAENISKQTAFDVQSKTRTRDKSGVAHDALHAPNGGDNDTIGNHGESDGQKTVRQKAQHKGSQGKIKETKGGNIHDYKRNKTPGGGIGAQNHPGKRKGTRRVRKRKKKVCTKGKGNINRNDNDSKHDTTIVRPEKDGSGLETTQTKGDKKIKRKKVTKNERKNDENENMEQTKSDAKSDNKQDHLTLGGEIEPNINVDTKHQGTNMSLLSDSEGL